jgi:hypothetical protein
MMPGISLRGKVDLRFVVWWICITKGTDNLKGLKDKQQVKRAGRVSTR